MSGIIYALRFRSGLIKFGFTKLPHQRLLQFRRIYGPDFEPIGAVPGTVEQEKELLELLSASRERGEFFRPSGMVMRVVKMMEREWPPYPVRGRGPKPKLARPASEPEQASAA